MNKERLSSIKIPCFTDKQSEALFEAADQAALRFCSPIYLVGSALNNERPNDIDIYIVVSQDSYLRLFTNYNRKTESEDDHFYNMREMLIQQARVYQKQKAYFEGRIKGWDFDIKFQNNGQFYQHDGGRVRLDAYDGIW